MQKQHQLLVTKSTSGHQVSHLVNSTLKAATHHLLVANAKTASIVSDEKH
jgi:hypothetical protein